MRPLYIDIVDKNSDILTETISGDLTFFINKFIELGFVTRTATDDVLSQHGVGNRERPGSFLVFSLHATTEHVTRRNGFTNLLVCFHLKLLMKDLAIILREAADRDQGHYYTLSNT